MLCCCHAQTFYKNDKSRDKHTMLWKRRMFFFSTVVSFGKWNTSWEADLLLPVWLSCRAVVDVFKVTDLVRLVFFYLYFIIFVVAKKKKKESFNEQYAISHSLCEKKTIIKMQLNQHCQLWNYSVQFVCMLSFCSRVCWKFHMKRIWYRGDKIMLKFVQHIQPNVLYSVSN